MTDIATCPLTVSHLKSKDLFAQAIKFRTEILERTQILENKVKSENLPNVCTFGKRQFSCNGSLNRHNKLHTGGRMYRCPRCMISFSSPFLFKNHSRKHHYTFPYQCKTCKRGFHTEDALACHQQSHNKVFDPSMLEDIKATFLLRKKYITESRQFLKKPTSNADQPVRRIKLQQDIALNRECNKLEKIWTHRGVQVDGDSLRSASSRNAFDMRVSLRSASSRNAFDMRVLNESLPSTSASVNKPIFEKASYHQRVSIAGDQPYYGKPLSVVKSIPWSTISKQLEESDLKDKPTQVMLYRSIDFQEVHGVKLCEKATIDEQNGKSEERMNSDLGERLQNTSSPCQDLEAIEHPNVCTEFAEMSLEDEQEGKTPKSQNTQQKMWTFFS